jgi:glycosyltransferase involved in cell wall biosynthesis
VSQRVLYIIGSQERRGAQRQLALLARELPGDEFEPHVCLLGPRRNSNAWLALDPQYVHPIERRWSLDPRAFSHLVRLIQRLRPAVVQSWLFDANAYGRAAALRAGVPAMVAVERGLDRRRSSTQWRVDRWLSRPTSCLLANSPEVLEFYLDRDVLPRAAEVIADGVQSPPPPPLSRDELLASLRIAGPVRLVMACGRLSPENRFKDLIWSTDILKIIHDDVHLVILGDGPQRRRLERYQKNVRIEDRVHFVGWRDDAPQLLALADLFWLAGDQQGMPASLLEAMAAGVPVVAADTASHRVIVESGRTGYLVPTGDRAALAKFANRLLEDRELARTMGQAARHDVLARFSVSSLVQNHVALYRRLLANASDSSQRP